MAGFTRTGSTACKFIEKSLKQYFLDNMTLRLTCIPAALDGVTAEELEDLLTTGVTAMVEVAAGGAGEDTICTVGTEVDEEGGNISWVTS